MSVPLFRIGQGYDIHRLVEGRELILGGIQIPYEKGLLGHSDADVLTHAIMDALLGALALGDIGQHFPPEDPAWKGADSIVLLQKVLGLVQDRHWQINNIDAVVVAEKPKLKPLIPTIQARLAQALQLDPDQVSVKATTNEKLDAVGAGEAMAAHAVVLLVQDPSAIG
jgi:2-C-methyl-D-erythritol 2,4-cyclodiphosphate synthase